MRWEKLIKFLDDICCTNKHYNLCISANSLAVNVDDFYFHSYNKFDNDIELLSNQNNNNISFNLNDVKEFSGSGSGFIIRGKDFYLSFLAI